MLRLTLRALILPLEGFAFFFTHAPIPIIDATVGLVVGLYILFLAIAIPVVWPTFIKAHGPWW